MLIDGSAVVIGGLAVAYFITAPIDMVIYNPAHLAGWFVVDRQTRYKMVASMKATQSCWSDFEFLCNQCTNFLCSHVEHSIGVPFNMSYCICLN